MFAGLLNCLDAHDSFNFPHKQWETIGALRVGR